jgi:group I intron endonuclease
MGYIYIFTSPNGKSYIGQTIRPIEKRLEEHESGKSKDCRAIYNAIQYHGWENFEKDWYYCPEEDLNKHEELMIEVLGTLAPDGYNLKGGGGSTGKLSEDSKRKISYTLIGRPKSEEFKQKISESTKRDKHPMYGKTHTEESKQKMSAASLGKTLSEETKQKISEAKQGEKNPRSKRVYQYDLEGNLLGSFGSSREAARHLEKDGSSICKCARSNKGCETAYGFKWSYHHLILTSPFT